MTNNRSGVWGERLTTKVSHAQTWSCELSKRSFGPFQSKPCGGCCARGTFAGWGIDGSAWKPRRRALRSAASASCAVDCAGCGPAGIACAAFAESGKTWGGGSGGGAAGRQGADDEDDAPVPQTVAACGIAGCRNPRVSCSWSAEEWGSPTCCGSSQPTSACNTGNDGNGK